MLFNDTTIPSELVDAMHEIYQECNQGEMLFTVGETMVHLYPGVFANETVLYDGEIFYENSYWIR